MDIIKAIETVTDLKVNYEIGPEEKVTRLLGC